jgi:hypothetical protein
MRITTGTICSFSISIEISREILRVAAIVTAFVLVVGARDPSESKKSARKLHPLRGLSGRSR